MSHKKDTHLFIPATIILLASFLAFNANIDSSPNHAHVPGAISNFLPTSITGAAITDISSCDPEDVLFQTNAIDNAHAYLAGSDQITAPYAVCPFPETGTGNAADFDCDPSCSNPTDPQCNAIMRLSSPENAHVEKKTETNYGVQLCYQDIFCDYVDFPDNCASLGDNFFCIATMSADTNAHLADCSGSSYNTQICCAMSVGPADQDGDGIPDSADNCPFIPNGPLQGSCSDSPLILCLSDAECPTGVCDTSQIDNDGDEVGSVCDNDDGDSCTVVTPGDSCPEICSFTDFTASWATTTASEGSSISITINGNTDCDNSQFFVSVKNIEDPTIFTQDPQPTTLLGGTASTTWIAEFHSEVTDNTYTLQATTNQNGTSLTITSSNTLTVTSNGNTAVCGNGFIEGSNDEECDDGNLENNDGCSENCTLEGIFGDECSNECPVQGLGVCQSDSTIKYCGNYDADLCLELSNTVTCSSNTECSTNYGDGICVPKVCEDAYQCSIGECIDGFKERTCVNTKSVNSCNYYSPIDKIPCIKIEGPTQIPIFTTINIILTILLLGLYYSVRKKH